MEICSVLRDDLENNGNKKTRRGYALSNFVISIPCYLLKILCFSVPPTTLLYSWVSC